ncbi:MAG: hypothetical protein ABI672_07425 [Vicinamibacteria bacterium]
MFKRPCILLLSLMTAPLASADTVNLTFGVIPPGKSSTVTINATIINSPSAVSNQGSISGTNFTSILTDDPGVGGATDPTLLAVSPPCPAITLGALNNSLVGASYTGSVTASGGSGPYAYSQTGLLPTGLSRINDALSGSTTSIGTFNFRITATDSGSCTGFRDYSVVVGSVVAPGDLVIREFRSRGPSGVQDEFVEIANTTATALTIAATDGSAGFGIAGQNVGPVCPAGLTQILGSIPSGTVIPSGGFFLAASNAGYSLANYGGAAASLADVTWTNDLCDNSGVALFTSSITLDTTTRLDAAGFVGSTSPYIEGAGIAVPAATGASQVTYLRHSPSGAIQDTGVNANDFFLGETTGATFGAVTARLASPGPQNASSEKAAGLTFTLADPAKGATVFPNRFRVTTTATTGIYYFRWKVTNNTGGSISQLRIRVANVTTLNSPGYVPAGTQADFRLIGSSDVAIAVPGAVTALGTTQQAPTGPPFDGGYNATASVTLPGGTLANGSAVYVNVAMRYQQAGSYVYFVSGEAK